MGQAGCNWQDHADIERWMKEWREEPARLGLDFRGIADPLDELKNRLARGDHFGKNEKSVRAFVAAKEGAAHRVSDHAKADREERAVTAAEASASSARHSVRVSVWAFAVSLAALVVAALAYLKG